MNTKTEELNKLFQDWENKIPEYKGHFVKDGINDEDLYNATNPKILFITKEPNNPNQETGDFRVWWEKDLKYTFSIRIAEWAFGIIHNFPPYDYIKRSEKEKIDALQSIAFMNVKKNGGNGTAKHKEIIEHIKMNLVYIHKEINIIEPDIIILGLSTKEIRSEAFPKQKSSWIESGYDIAINRYDYENGKYAKMIDFYHPSARNGASASYSLMQNVVKSLPFCNL